MGGDWTTLPGNFKRNGYFVTGTGKTFHPGDPYQFDYPCAYIRATLSGLLQWVFAAR